MTTASRRGDGTHITSPPTAVGLVVSLLVLPVLAMDVFEGTGLHDPLVGDAVKWGLAFVVVGITLWWERLPLASLGLERPGRRTLLVDLAVAVVTGAVAVALFTLTTPLVEALGLPQESGASIEVPSLAIGVVSAVTAGVTEEILFRGYPIERMLGSGLSPVAAGGATWGLFVLAHVPSYPLGAVVQISAVAAVFTAVYLWRRSLVAVVGGHVLVDLVGVLYVVFG